MVLMALIPLAAGCASHPAAATTAKRSAAGRALACPTPRTVYLFRATGGMASQESMTWLRISLLNFPHESSELYEAVIPAATTWTLRDLRVDRRDGRRIASFMQDAGHGNPAMYNYGNPSVVAADVCFTSWNRVRVLKLSVVSGEAADRAAHLTRGFYGVSPTTVPPGGAITLLLLQGSNDDALYLHPWSGTVRWWAVPYGKIAVYPVAITRVSTGTMDILRIELPRDLPKGRYFLALLGEQEVQNLGPGFMNGNSDGDFSFEVR
jgi:hypothetical protein